jgi:hypothetical protein
LTEYKVKYHITFTHDDGREEVIYDDRIIDCISPEEAERILLEQYEFDGDALTDFPDWFGSIAIEELDIDEIVKSQDND